MKKLSLIALALLCTSYQGFSQKRKSKTPAPVVVPGANPNAMNRPAGPPAAGPKP